MSITPISFQLDVDDGWPPVAAEVLQCVNTGPDFCIESPPLFVKGLSVGDVIRATPDNEGRVWDWQHVSKSRRSTIWMALCDQGARDDVDTVLKRLKYLGCRVTASGNLGCYAVDVPAECSIDLVDMCLNVLDAESVAVAFPSFRHEDAPADS